MPVKKYEIPLPSADVRYRVEFELERGRILGFVVQLEFQGREAWMPVVRYDTAHSFAHCDRYRPDGTAVKHQPLPVIDYNQALTFAVEDVKTNWESYVHPFREARHEDV